MILVYITNKNKKEAKKIANNLLNKKLIACANMFPVESLYKWKGELCSDDEVVLIAKSIEKNFNKIKKEVRKIHSYECPCIIKINAKANKEFEEWVMKNCT